jgi:hypothetical protein
VTAIEKFKMKNKHKKIKRVLSIPISITEETGKTVSFQLNNGKGVLIDSNGKKLPLPEGVKTTYQGENKIKTVNAVFADNIYLDATDAISEYEKILIVDTNSKKVNNLNIAIGVMILCNVNLGKDSFTITPISLLTDCFPDCWTNQPSQSPFPMQYENYMWANFLSIIRDKSIENFQAKTVMIVDSDLGNLPKYNDHKTKFFNGLIYPCKDPVLVLPENITMFYAKSDKPNDSVLNSYIACCDEISNKIFSEIMKSLCFDSTTIIDRNVVLQEFQKIKKSLNNYFLKCLKNKGLLL